MSLNHVTAQGIEKLANRLLSLDAEASQQLQQLTNKSVLIQVEDWQLDYLFVFVDGYLSVSEPVNSDDKTNDLDENSNDTQPSATIKGKLPSFISAAVAEQSGDAIFQGDLHFSGDINTAKQFQQLASKLDIDWQEPFAQVFGDFVGHTIATGLDLFGAWAKNVNQSLKQDVSEYLQEEARVTPSDAEQQLFFNDVDSVRSRADRLLAKAKQVIEAKEKGKTTL